MRESFEEEKRESFLFLFCLDDLHITTPCLCTFEIFDRYRQHTKYPCGGVK